MLGSNRQDSMAWRTGDNGPGGGAVEKAHARADFALKARSAGPVTNFANNPRGETAMSRLKAFLERKLAEQDAKRAQRVGNQPVWPYPLPRILAAVVLV